MMRWATPRSVDNPSRLSSSRTSLPSRYPLAFPSPSTRLRTAVTCCMSRSSMASDSFEMTGTYSVEPSQSGSHMPQSQLQTTLSSYKLSSHVQPRGAFMCGTSSTTAFMICTLLLSETLMLQPRLVFEGVHEPSMTSVSPSTRTSALLSLSSAIATASSISVGSVITDEAGTMGKSSKLRTMGNSQGPVWLTHGSPKDARSWLTCCAARTLSTCATLASSISFRLRSSMTAARSCEESRLRCPAHC
mmetsp:Transcript_66947/g.189917  ORF Transcript_66947/g.189917 Transcript_66947/m.189917 type:complete len:246 (+) Transcript_66947:875-1612(+)